MLWVDVVVVGGPGLVVKLWKAVREGVVVVK